MNADLEALLALQRDDAEIRELERRRRALEPRLRDIARRRTLALDALEGARHAAESEESRVRDLETRVAEHRHLHERNVAQLDQVRRARDAAVAASQVEQARRMLADEESDLHGGARRLGDLRHAVALHERAVADVEREYAEGRRQLDAEIAGLDATLDDARRKRADAAGAVSRALLARYERISARRNADAVFPLRGPSCASCDTALPLQRRSMMTRTGAIEICEACGVLLYAAE